MKDPVVLRRRYPSYNEIQGLDRKKAVAEAVAKVRAAFPNKIYKRIIGASLYINGELAEKNVGGTLEMLRFFGKALFDEPGVHHVVLDAKSMRIVIELLPSGILSFKVTR